MGLPYYGLVRRLAPRESICISLLWERHRIFLAWGKDIFRLGIPSVEDWDGNRVQGSRLKATLRSAPFVGNMLAFAPAQTLDIL